MSICYYLYNPKNGKLISSGSYANMPFFKNDFKINFKGFTLYPDEVDENTILLTKDTSLYNVLFVHDRGYTGKFDINAIIVNREQAKKIDRYLVYLGWKREHFFVDLLDKIENNYLVVDFL